MEQPAPIVAPCQKCGHPHLTRFSKQACRAHRRDGSPCSNYPIAGGLCRFHGGAAPATIAKQRKADLRAQAERDLAQLMGVPIGKGLGGQGLALPIPNPVEEVLNQMRIAVFNEQWYRDVLQTRGILQRAPDDQGVMWEKAAVVLELWNEERDRVVRIGKIAHGMGIAALQIKATQDLVERIAAGYLAIASDAAVALTEAQKEAFRHVAARELLRLTSEGVDG